MRRFAILAVGAALFATAPAVSQNYVSDSEPFISAVSSRDGNKATELLDARPTLVNSRNVKGQIALNIVIARNDETWLHFLLGKGADPNLAASNGDTPLITAARVGYDDAIALLLARGARVNASNRMGETAIIAAVQARQVESVKLLLAKGADPDKRDSAAGYSAREYAKRDTRNRDLLSAIEGATKKPTEKAPAKDLDSFKLD